MKLHSKSRIILSLSLILLTAFLGISVLNFVSARKDLEEEVVQSSMPLLRENIYSTILYDVLPAMHTSSLMANDSLLIDWVEDGEEEITAISGYLQRIAEQYDFITAFFVSDESRKYYHPKGLHKVVDESDDHDVWYFSFLETGRMFDLDVDTNETANDILTIFINFRLENEEGRLLGVTGVGLEMRNFSGFLAEQQRQFDRQIFLVDENGIIQAHSDMRMIETSSIWDKEGMNLIAGDILVRSDQPYSGTYRNGRKKIIVTSRYIPEIDWFVVVEHDEKSLLEDTRRHLFESLAIGFLAFILVLALSLGTLKNYETRIEAMAITDALTGIANRRALETALPRMLYRHRRLASRLSVMMIDFDGFKALNDSHGHQAGDNVLTAFARTVIPIIRPDDLMVRWGGDEFVLVTESPIDDAVSLAESIRSAFREIEDRVSLSIGVAEAAPDDDPSGLLSKADAALYKAKHRGRDQVVRFISGM